MNSKIYIYTNIWDLGSKCDRWRCLIKSEMVRPFNRGDTIINKHFTLFIYKHAWHYTVNPLYNDHVCSKLSLMLK